MSGAAPSASRLRPHLLQVRQQLEETRQAIRDQHDRGLPSVQVCTKLTLAVDAAVLSLFDAALDDLPPKRRDLLRSQCTLVAHGGYGRRRMAPFSDVDLMILHEGKTGAEAEHIARRLTQDIFDIGLQLGGSLRTINQAIALAKSDPVICTSLIESRWLAGGQELYERFSAAFLKMVQRRPRAMSAAFVEARRAERQKYGETVYLLEPNIKRSRGGLRDLHLLRWLWFVHAGVSDLDRLRREGVISNFDHRRLTSSRDFLLRVRNDSHFDAGKPRDALHRGEQVRLAEKLGYLGREGLLPVEQFMRDYFRHAGHIWFLAARVSELSSPTPTVTTVLGAMFGRNIERDYRLDAREISATQACRARLTTRLDEALRLVDLARLSDRRISQDTWYLVYRAAPNYSSQPDPTVTARFLEIIDNPMQLGQLLRRLHELGVLEKVIPEFARARCLLQFNQYHKFTVDEHCIRAVEQATRFDKREDQLGSVYRRIAKKRQLHLALMLHDLGKGHEEDHSVLGAQIAVATGERFGLPADETKQIEFLVRRHLWMSHLAFRRDTNDAEMVADFAAEVGSLETLQMLFVLTCADLAAVGPGVLNAWKVTVLADLYKKAAETFKPGDRLKVEDRRSAMRTAVWRLLPEDKRDDAWNKRQFNALPESLVMSRSPAAVVDLLSRLEALADGKATAWGKAQENSGTLELLAGVHRGAGRGVFSSMAGALSAAGLQIIAAESNIMPDDLLVLRYEALDPATSRDPLSTTPPNPPANQTALCIDDLCTRMVRSVGDQTPPKFPHVWGAEEHASQAALTNLPNEVRLDTVLSDHWLIIEVFTTDRLGLLYDLARTLHDLGLVIRFAKIATTADQVVDVFYVAERDDTKPTGEDRLEAIRSRLLGIVEPES